MSKVRTTRTAAAAMLLATSLAACGNLGPTESKGSTSWPPEGQIKIIVPLDAGGGTDTLARQFASELESQTGAQVVVQNRPGGGTVTGMNEVHEAEPDGTTLMMVGTTIASVDAADQSELTPDDFTVLGMVNSDPAAIAVSTDSPWRSIDEFVEHVRDNPDEVRVATANPQGVWDVVASTLAADSDLPWRPIPTEGGAAPAITAVLGGRIEAVLVSPAEMQEQIRAENLRVLAVAGDELPETLADTPTFEEAGLAPNPPSTFRPILGPPGMSQELQDDISKAVAEVASSPELQDQMADDWLNSKVLDPQETRKFLDRQVSEYADYFASTQ